MVSIEVGAALAANESGTISLSSGTNAKPQTLSPSEHLCAPAYLPKRRCNTVTPSLLHDVPRGVHRRAPRGCFRSTTLRFEIGRPAFGERPPRPTFLTAENSATSARPSSSSSLPLARAAAAWPRFSLSALLKSTPIGHPRILRERQQLMVARLEPTAHVDDHNQPRQTLALTKIARQQPTPVLLDRGRNFGKPVARQVDQPLAGGQLEKVDQLGAPRGLARFRELTAPDDAR